MHERQLNVTCCARHTLMLRGMCCGCVLMVRYDVSTVSFEATPDIGDTNIFDRIKALSFFCPCFDLYV